MKIAYLPNRKELLERVTQLEIKADHYSRTDWDAYQSVLDELREIDSLLLDMYNAENESFLQNIDKA